MGSAAIFNKRRRTLLIDNNFINNDIYTTVLEIAPIYGRLNRLKVHLKEISRSQEDKVPRGSSGEKR